MITFSEHRLDWLFEQFRGKKILVLGDLMLDHYVWGTVSRISPEAPVPVVEVTSEFIRLGGAANVVHNLFSLGSTPIPIGTIGDDQAGEQLLALMRQFGFLTDFIVKDSMRPTTIKTRIIANDQHVVRADRESRNPISADIIARIRDGVTQNIRQADALILQDYNKGLLTRALIRSVIEIANQNHKIVTVDPKFDNFFEYQWVSLFKPNRKEAEAALGTSLTSLNDIEQACRTLMERLACRTVLITLGSKGMCFVDANGEFKLVPTKARQVHDVSGAGDTVISTLTLALTTGADLKEAITLANFAAGVVCGEVGVVPIEPSKLRDAIRHFS
ncbi:MAG: D-glycero-beta-D-manno-heptose-7-phosphate kinase [candidate division KSB1 bacterium]|nr:D-glycero-beta-D-manno-heptose-7-phosphate kinase [candidate division KSB1 bacterium]MDZ7318217.1 D-glycero-beta-D-manno-heptose-7-phosphate kinase [candidate division KSB1 bacterium]MDZ7341026.1 D-glycero-beta-D-manno-heptose-7-phosphate kinase [candidate division KSB1 bacterium]